MEARGEFDKEIPKKLPRNDIPESWCRFVRAGQYPFERVLLDACLCVLLPLLQDREEHETKTEGCSSE